MCFFQQLRHKYYSIRIMSIKQLVESYCRIYHLTNGRCFYMMLRYFWGMIRFCLAFAQIKSFGGVSPWRKLVTFFIIVVPHLTEGIFRPTRTAAKVLKSGFYWPSIFQDGYAFVKTCDYCQRVGNISRRQELPLKNLLDLW